MLIFNSDLKILYSFNNEMTETIENISFWQAIFKSSTWDILNKVKGWLHGWTRI